MIELNKIYNEDCLEGMKRIPDKSIDMILCAICLMVTRLVNGIQLLPFEPLGAIQQIIQR